MKPFGDASPGTDSETMAEKFWPKQEALGERLQFYGDEGFYREVVGIVETSNYVTLGEDPQACAFLPLRQNYSDAMSPSEAT